MEEVKKVLFFFLSVLLLKLCKKRPRGTFDVISGFMGSEKPGLKICMNTSIRLKIHHSLKLGVLRETKKKV